MPQIGRVFLSIYLWCVILILTICFSVPSSLIGILSFAIDRKRKIAHQINSAWGKAIFGINPLWKLKIYGKGFLKKNGTYVLVANHQSMSDIVCLFAIGRQFKWVAKQSLYAIPFLGWAMRAAGYIELERGKHGSIRNSYEKARSVIGQNVSVLFFPEGTRSRSGKLGTFKNGAFRLAIETGVPIVPIVITGSYEALKKGKTLLSSRIHCVVKILKPITTTCYNPKDSQDLCGKVRSVMQRELDHS